MSKLGKIASLLSTDEFNYSKDWRESDQVGRVEWLIQSVKQKSLEIKALDDRIEELVKELERKERR